MTSYSTYSRPISAKIMQLMKEAFGSTFTTYYDGDPVYIPAQNLPCLILSKPSTAITGRAPTGMMRLEHTISVQAEFDKRREFNQNPDKVLLETKLQQIAEGIDPTTDEIGEQTLVGILQRNVTLGSLSIGQTLTIEYGLFPRGQDVLTQGVTVTGVFQELRAISNRA